tara:strand:+ start:612 stop:884 length:273 start_codon:yes stop_codon:yes gene_type:complete
MQENKYKFLILFDKKTKINQSFFNKNLFLKKTIKNSKVLFGKLSDIKKFNLIILIGFTKKIKLKKKKNILRFMKVIYLKEEVFHLLNIKL